MSSPADQTLSPGDRATTFTAVSGAQPEHYSGEVLLVAAYAAAFIILLAWVALSWRKLVAAGARIEGLERAIDDAAAKSRSDVASKSDGPPAAQAGTRPGSAAP